MATHFPVVFEREDWRGQCLRGWRAGLCTRFDTRKATTAIVRTLGAYLEAHPREQPRAEVRVAKVRIARRVDAKPQVNLVTAAALVGAAAAHARPRALERMGVLAGVHERPSPNRIDEARVQSNFSPRTPTHHRKPRNTRDERARRINQLEPGEICETSTSSVTVMVVVAWPKVDWRRAWMPAASTMPP